MTEKEKAEAYDKALERARAINNGKDVDVESGTTTCEYIFPELKEENNDKRIKKNCIHFLELQKQHHAATFSIEECITWLEKQGKEECALKSFKDKDVRKFMQYIEKQAKAYEFNLPNRSYDIYAFAKDILVWLEKQGEQKPCMIQWKGDNLKEVIGFTGKDKNFEKWFKSFEEYERYVHEHNDIFKLFNENGSHYEIPVGAWIVKTPDGYNIASNAVLKQKSINERAWLYLVSDVLTWKDGIGQYLDDPRVQELAKRLCNDYAQKLYRIEKKL